MTNIQHLLDNSLLRKTKYQEHITSFAKCFLKICTKSLIACYKINLQNIQRVQLERFRIFDAKLDVTCSPSKKGRRTMRNIKSNNSKTKAGNAIESFGISLVLLPELHF